MKSRMAEWKRNVAHVGWREEKHELFWGETRKKTLEDMCVCVEARIILNWTILKWDCRAGALECVIRQKSVDVNLPHIYKSGHLYGFADGINIVGGTMQTAVKVQSDLEVGQNSTTGLMSNNATTKGMIR